ncbi:energy-coupling factor transporter transmembrane protein EcfT [Paenibacillus sp. N1-5-1-14]|uniref:energy-coupling factor transporter transmembrane component T family protein n=1 Tax=Paenibacillus radicibacter TaxID=2972488 RepID=UPI002158DBDF|nr:energy-coupling factor transporter transmembrane component T [Paenibacillus radicibacter]MCR8641110.1 energy-coupling factor transporter transmembrane protein EcfT [Paenibacillus radicibacter]
MIFQYQIGESFFHRIDPVSKLVWVIVMSILLLSYERADVQLGLFGAVGIIGLVGAKLWIRAIWRAIRIPLYIGIPYFILQLLFVSGETVIWKIGTFEITAEALDFAIAISIRFLTLILVSFLFVATTEPRMFVLALSQHLKLPYRFTFAILIALRFVPLLEKEAETIRLAQRLRGLREPKGLRNRYIAWKRFVLAVFIQAVRRAQQTANAMDTKGFGVYTDRTYLNLVPVLASGVYFAIGSGLVMIGLLIFV